MTWIYRNEWVALRMLTNGKAFGIFMNGMMSYPPKWPIDAIPMRLFPKNGGKSATELRYY